MKIIIDAGHGGNEYGAVSNDYIEKDMNLTYAKKIYNILKDYADVELTRDSDITFGLNSRAAWVKSKNADLCISCHLNAFDGKARGVEGIHSIKATPGIIKLTNEIVDDIATLGIPKRRVFSRESSKKGYDYYGLIRGSNSNTIIIEPLFIDNPEDQKLLKQDRFMDKLAANIANTIIKHYGLVCRGNDINKAIETLNNTVVDGIKIISSPGYWIDGFSKGQVNIEYVKTVLIRCAKALRK